jgi:hypothetical protein
MSEFLRCGMAELEEATAGAVSEVRAVAAGASAHAVQQVEDATSDSLNQINQRSVIDSSFRFTFT